MRKILCLLLLLPLLLPAHVSAKTPLVYKDVCSAPSPGHVACDSVAARVYDSASPFGPDDLRRAYNLPCSMSGQCTDIASGPTVAIVDAGSDATIESDLAMYDTRFGLPACTTTNGCLRITNENGGSTPPADLGWSDEIALDVETVHGICETCKILLVEGSASTFDALGTGVDTAVRMGALVVSNSYGANGDDPGAAHYYNHPGVGIFASSGDSGFGLQSPASNPGVIAVGGTSLTTNYDGSYDYETAWTGAGSGCSTTFAAPSYQLSLPNWKNVGCGSFRAEADVSAVADPHTGVLIASGGTWWQIGGTSLSSPLVAAAAALAGGVSDRSVLYEHAAGFRDVTSGSNGSCQTAICVSGAGYDGPTGLGSPNGLSGFGAPIVTPSPTSTPTPTATTPPTQTPRPTTTPTPSFPLSAWRAYTDAHRLPAIRHLDAYGKETVIAWAWWHDRGLMKECGGVMKNSSTFSVFSWTFTEQTFQGCILVAHAHHVMAQGKSWSK